MIVTHKVDGNFWIIFEPSDLNEIVPANEVKLVYFDKHSDLINKAEVIFYNDDDSAVILSSRINIIFKHD